MSSPAIASDGGRRALDSRPQLVPSLLQSTLLATLALAPLEGYLQAVNGQLSKLAPALFLLVWVVHRLLNNRPFGVSHPVVWWSLGLMSLVLASSAVHIDQTFTIVYLARWIPFLIFVVALADVVAHEVAPWTALLALVAGAAASALGAVISFVFFEAPRATGPMTDPNDLAYVLTAAVPIMLLSGWRSKSARSAWVSGVVIALLLVGAAATLSRGGGLATALVLVWALARGLIPARLAAAALGLLGSLGMAILLLAQPAVEQAIDQKEYIAGTNVDTRLLRWHAAARMLGDNLLLGVGPGGFREKYVQYSRLAELAEQQPVAHQMYLEVGAELGLIALVCFLGAILGALVATEKAVRRCQSVRTSANEDLRLAALATQGSLLAICASSMFLSEQYYLALWAALGIAAAVDWRTRRGST